MVTATNTARQPNGTISALPVSGARIGDTLNTSMTSDISRVASMPVCRSRMMARGMTITDEAPMPWTTRKKISHSMLGASAQPTEPAMKSAKADIERRLAADHVGDRPVDDLADAERHEEDTSVICVAAVDALRSAAMVGSAGRYMSIANGPTADSKPSTIAFFA